jgi:hypothetical protein
VLSAGFFGAGFLVPGAAEALLRLYLPALALAFILARVHEAALPQRLAQEGYSPFLHGRNVPAPDEAPGVVRERAQLVSALDDPSRANAPIPVSVRWLVVGELGRCLAERRGLFLADRAHHAAVRELLSEPAWSLVRPPGSERAETSPLSLRDLDAILDDLEKL